MTEPFFSRWSQRKQALSKGLPADEPVVLQKTTTPSATAPPPVTAGPASEGVHRPSPRDAKAAKEPSHADDVGQTPSPDTAEAPPNLPTLEDVRDLTPSSDFQPFMRQGVASDVRNAAVKKLFSDPRFNIMDGLDIYIGDYNTPDPLPAGMLQKMVGAQFLKLFPDLSATPQTPGLDSAGPAPQAQTAQAAVQAIEPRTYPEPSPASPENQKDVSQSQAARTAPPLPPTTALHTPAPSPHDHPDLQLQPNHAPASPSPGSSPG